MYVYALVTRAIVVLLVARAVAAPVSLRPSHDGPPTRSVLVVRRAYGWPQQRLERFSHSSKLLKLFRGKNRPVTVDVVLVRDSRATPIPLSSTTPSTAPRSLGARAASQMTDHLRC